MANKITNTQYYSDIANAIRGKNGLTDTYTPAQMAAAITAIPSGGGGDDDIDWTDFEAQSTSTGIVMLVRILFPRSCTISFPTEGTRQIDWGDGTQESVSSTLVSHTYSVPGDYLIIVDMSSNITSALTWGALECSKMGMLLGLSIGNRVRSDVSITGGYALRRLKINQNISGGTLTLSALYSLTKLVINHNGQIKSMTNMGKIKSENITIVAPNNQTLPTQSGNWQISAAYIPDNASTTASSTFASDISLERVVIPDTLTSLSTNMFMNNLSLRYVELKGLIGSIPSNFAYGCSNLQALVFSGNTTVPQLASTSSFSNSSFENGVGYIYVPDNLVSQWKTATNWATFANQIKPLSELPAEYQED